MRRVSPRRAADAASGLTPGVFCGARWPQRPLNPWNLKHNQSTPDIYDCIKTNGSVFGKFDLVRVARLLRNKRRTRGPVEEMGFWL